MRLILASSSPYRQDMLKRLRVPFIAVTPNVDETPLPGEDPVSLAMRLSRAKAAAVASKHPDAVVIGSDQVACLNDRPIGKPGDHEGALAQLRMLSGQVVEFHSALCVMDNGRELTEDIVTICRFRHLEEDEIRYYLEQERPYDTAGSAKAEGLGIALMETMEADDPTAIIGLPLIALSRMLREFGINPLLNNPGATV